MAARHTQEDFDTVASSTPIHRNEYVSPRRRCQTPQDPSQLVVANNHVLDLWGEHHRLGNTEDRRAQVIQK